MIQNDYFIGVMVNKVADSASIVLLGSFNPGIFHPAWFQKQELLPQVEAEAAKIEVISNDIAIFTVAWLRIEATGDKFVARTTDESKFGPLRDLVVGMFQLLEQTPVNMIGMNREISFELASVEQWHAVGHALAPKELWLKYVKEPGMKSLLMESRRDDERHGQFNISVKPTPLKPCAVTVEFNDHIVFKGDEKGDEIHTAGEACKAIEEDWEKSLGRSWTVSNGLISDALLVSNK